MTKIRIAEDEHGTGMRIFYTSRFPGWVWLLIGVLLGIGGVFVASALYWMFR